MNDMAADSYEVTVLGCSCVHFLFMHARTLVAVAAAVVALQPHDHDDRGSQREFFFKI